MKDSLRSAVTYLQMKEPPESLPEPEGAVVQRLINPDIKKYLEIYLKVGSKWLWYERLFLSEKKLEEVICDEKNLIYFLSYKGEDAGFYELDVNNSKNIQLVYFGLVPEFIGKGLGRFLLSHAIKTAFDRKPERLWLHTCDKDSPKALAVYQKAGFEIYRTETQKITFSERENKILNSLK